ncbi:MAG: heme ABC exporter ATP-binding protein CcmA [Alphaproteobacteria bacterium]|nr:heme ABC exporter ATP-binding protein CcmA [Hyphomonas sp.]MBR9808233.1 heme ABC exporter ATP-binding protein CcmA [Alphaproteobacteria bacterium]
MSTRALLSATDLGMIRGERILFRNVSLAAHAGEAIVLRGANGAGKTTLLRILAGLTRPETGNVNRAASHHWIAHREGLKPHETPRTHLGLWARAWGAPTDQIDDVLNKMALIRPSDVSARHLSAGQRRRTALARLLLQERPVWLLDEPLTALDADGRELLLGMIFEHRMQGGTIIAAIHGDAGFDSTCEVTI